MNYRIYDKKKGKYIDPEKEIFFLTPNGSWNAPLSYINYKEDDLEIEFGSSRNAGGTEIFQGDMIYSDNCLPNRYDRYEVVFERGIFGIKRGGIDQIMPVSGWEWCHTFIDGTIHDN